jgi:hypothetical protein
MRNFFCLLFIAVGMAVLGAIGSSHAIGQHTGGSASQDDGWDRDVKTFGRLHYSTFASYPNSEASRDAASTPNPAAVAVSDTSYSC